MSGTRGAEDVIAELIAKLTLDEAAALVERVTRHELCCVRNVGGAD